jgi:hypothetical protein
MMAELIDIEMARAARNAPDADCLSTDSDGHAVFMFSVGYRHQGRRYSIDIWARSEQDAAEHVASMRETLWLEGKVISVVPQKPGQS